MYSSNTFYTVRVLVFMRTINNDYRLKLLVKCFMTSNWDDSKLAHFLSTGDVEMVL